MIDRAGSASAARDRRLRWHCRRGMKELDVLLERAVGRLLPGAQEAERDGLEQLLALPDPLLAAYFLGGESPAEPQQAQLVARLKALCRLDDRPAVFCGESHSGPAC